MRDSTLIKFCVTVSASLALAAPAAAAPTDLDPLFDGDGVFVGAATIADRGVVDTKIDSHGRIVTLTSSGSPSDIRVERFNPDGSPDTSFDTDGVRVIDIAGSFDHGNELYVNDDDSILIAANVRITTGSEFALVKLEEDGDLDVTFGGGGSGWVATPVGYSDSSYGLALDVRSDDKIVVGGEADGNPTATEDQDFALARYNSDGTIDTTFGFNNDATPGDPNDRLGWITQSLEPLPNERIVKLWAMSDGTTLAAGRTQTGLDPHFGLARFLDTGFIDATFATGGHTTVPAITNVADIPYDATMQADGKIVMVGETLWDDTTFMSGRSDKDFGVARLNSDGSLDATFAGDGTLAIDFGLEQDVASGVTTDECGRIVVAGSTGDGFGPGSIGNAADQLAVARVWPDGNLDTTFGIDGRYTDAVGTVDDVAGSVAIQPSDNKIVVAGISAHDSMTVAGKTLIERLTGGGECTQPVPQAPPADSPVAPVEAAAKITTPKQKRVHRAARLLKIAGTTTGSGIDQVQIALRREEGGRCVWLKSSTGKQRRSRKRGDCVKTTWLNATGTTDWSYAFKRKLPKGAYRLYVRLKLADGSFTRDFVSGENSIRFTIR